MRKYGKIGKATQSLLLGVICLLAAGCGHAPICEEPLSSALAPHVAQLPEHDSNVSSAAAAPKSLQDLLDLALKQHPELRMARAKVEAAHGAFIQAGLYPNPIVGPSIQSINDRDNAAGEIGVQISQLVITARKLEWAQAAAAQGVTASDWQAMTQWFNVVTRVRLAHVELLAAQRERDTVAELERVANDILKAAETLEKAGAGNRPDVLRAEVELQQQKLRKSVADTKVGAARRLLAAAVGIPGLDLSQVRGSLDDAPPAYAWDTLLDWMLQTSGEMHEARALAAQAETLVQLAQANAIPDVNVQALPQYDFRQQQITGQLLVTAGVLINNRNEGNIISAKAELARARANEQAVALRLRERLALAYQRFQAAQVQVDALGKQIEPKARESLKLVEIGYRGGDAKYNYTALLQAQQVLFGVQLSRVQALGDWQRAAAELAGIAQLKNWGDAPSQRK